MLRRWLALAALGSCCLVACIPGTFKQPILIGYHLTIYRFKTYPIALIAPSGYASWNAPERAGTPWPNASTAAVDSTMNYLWIFGQCALYAENAVSDYSDSELVVGHDANGDPLTLGAEFDGSTTDVANYNFAVMSSYEAGGLNDTVQTLISTGSGSNLFYTDELYGPDENTGQLTFQVGGLTPMGDNQSAVIAATVPSTWTAPARFDGIPEHEMGHQMGLGHNTTYGNLMMPGTANAGYLLTGAIDSSTTSEPGTNTQCGTIRQNTTNTLNYFDH